MKAWRAQLAEVLAEPTRAAVLWGVGVAAVVTVGGFAVLMWRRLKQ